MPFLDAIRLALQQIWVQKLKSFFTLLGVMIGVTFLIAVVSIVGGMSRYMSDQLVGKLMAVNSFELRHRPNIDMGDHDDTYYRDLRRRPRIKESDIEPVTSSLPEGVLWAAVGYDNLTASSRYVAKPKSVRATTVTDDYFTIKRMAPVNGRLFSQKDDFELETSDSALEFWNKIKSYLVIAGVALPAIGLVVGAIVIMNIMLVAVAERTREIGIRKSLGARRRDIMSQFLVESATLSTIGASLGVAAGFGFAKLIAAVSTLPAAVELWSVILGIGIGAGVGIVAGVYPASRASRLDPITALRAE